MDAVAMRLRKIHLKHFIHLDQHHGIIIWDMKLQAFGSVSTNGTYTKLHFQVNMKKKGFF